MSIYVSLVSLEDYELGRTVNGALSTADNPASINVGVAACVGDEFFNKFAKPLSLYNKTVAVKQFDPAQSKGLGIGRALSRFAYSGEDYILQVDPHTHFQQGWDTFLLEQHEAAVKEAGTSKTILTSYLPSYTTGRGAVVEIDDHWSRYCVMFHRWMNEDTNIRDWFDIPVRMFPDDFRPQAKNFYPAIKAVACFMFGDKSFAEYSGLPSNVIFWEEEIVQTINLLNNDFALVFPNMELPLAHRYNFTGSNRQTGFDLYNTRADILAASISRNFRDFIKNDPEGCEKYKRYSGYDVLTGDILPFHIPDHYLVNEASNV